MLSELVVSEAALRHWHERFKDEPRITLRGLSVAISLHLPLTDPSTGDVVGYGTAVTTGLRSFGGEVVFPLPLSFSFTFTCTARLSHRSYLHRSALTMMDVLTELCRCGQPKAHCDCCKACKGRGWVVVAPKPSRATCAVCGGKGYKARLRASLSR